MSCSGDEEEEEDEEPTNASDAENQGSDDLPSVKSSVVDEEGGEEEGTSENDLQSVSSSHRGASTDASPLEPSTVGNPSPSDSPSQSELVETNHWQSPISPSQPITNSDSMPPSPVVVSTNPDLLLTSCETKSTNGQSSPPSPVGSDSTRNFRKRRRSVEIVTQTTDIKRQKANSIR